jgi:membrane protein DedA with SNARE-associated domain
MKLLLDLLHFIQPYGIYSYAVIFAVLLACGFGLPMPEDITLVAAGILVSRGIIDLKMSVFVCMAGVLIGDGTIFFLGSRYGSKIRTSKFFSLILPERRDAMVKSIFQKYGDKVIFMARFMPGLRTPLFFATGSYHVPFWKFLALDGFAAVISVPFWIYVGYLFGANLEELERVIKKAQYGVFAALIALVLLFVLGFFIKRKLAKISEPPV